VTVLRIWLALAAISSGALAETWPLLGDLDKNGGRNYAAVFCENQPDDSAPPPDPRELISGRNIDNRNFAEIGRAHV